MNAALGFDTYLVIRHGLRSAEDSMDCSESDANLCKIAQSIDGTQLGCYFCNDVVAPGNVSTGIYTHALTVQDYARTYCTGLYSCLYMTMY